MRASLAVLVSGLGLALAAGCGSSSNSNGGSGGNAGVDAGASGGTGGSGTGGSGTGGSATGGTGTGGAGTGGTAGGGTGGTAGSGTGGTAGSGTGGTAGSGTGGTAGSGTGGAAGSGGTGGAGGGHAIKTVFLIIMENKAWCEVKGSSDAPYINNTILKQAAFATQYKGPLNGNLHPSEPNYIWLEAGSNLGITTDDDPAKNHQSTTDHLVTYMKNAGVTWRSYQEDISGTVCPLTGVGNYKPKHDPMVFFDDVTNTNDPNSQYCISHNRPLTELDADLANNTVAQYNLVTPNQCHDMHSSCAPENNEVKQGDNWLATWIPKITASQAYKNGGAIFITWDEAETSITGGSACCILGNCPIGMMVLSPDSKAGGYNNNIAYDHSSTLKTMQEIFSITPLLRNAGAAGTKDLSDLFKSFP